MEKVTASNDSKGVEARSASLVSAVEEEEAESSSVGVVETAEEEGVGVATSMPSPDSGGIEGSAEAEEKASLRELSDDSTAAELRTPASLALAARLDREDSNALCSDSDASLGKLAEAALDASADATLDELVRAIDESSEVLDGFFDTAERLAGWLLDDCAEDNGERDEEAEGKVEGVTESSGVVLVEIGDETVMLSGRLEV